MEYEKSLLVPFIKLGQTRGLNTKNKSKGKAIAWTKTKKQDKKRASSELLVPIKSRDISHLQMED